MEGHVLELLEQFLGLVVRLKGFKLERASEGVEVETVDRGLEGGEGTREGGLTYCGFQTDRFLKSVFR